MKNIRESPVIAQTKNKIRNRMPFIIPPIQAVRSYIKQCITKLSVRRLLAKNKTIFLEIGSGEKRGGNGWTTLDMTATCDLFWDLKKGLPFPNGSISKIYSSHLFEHFSFKEGQKLLEECFRVLIPGGIFLICVPNARIYIEAYLENKNLDKELFFSGWKPAYNNTTKIDYVNYIAYMDEHHKYMFDEENLLHILKSKGFINVRPREFDPTLDRKVRKHESIYAEGTKRKG